jgi:hypothetical protein
LKLIRSTDREMQFRLGAREKQVLLALLSFYPCLPPAHQRLSKSGGLPGQEASQALLEEALAEQRQENRNQLQTLLADPRRLEREESGWRLSLSLPDLEWLLQVLNDIRIGSWVLLGSPEKGLGRVDPTTARQYWAMEMSGLFQMQFLGALHGSEPGPGRAEHGHL